jgi:hypothetical protein
MAIDDLPTLAQVQADRASTPNWKPKTRLEAYVDEKPRTLIDEKEFRRQVWERDHYRCRCCERPVRKVLGRIPDRGEVNHIHGRTGDLRFEVRAAILMCLTCHEQFTGRVNAHRLRIIPSQTFTIRQGTFTDATYPVRFEVVA